MIRSSPATDMLTRLRWLMKVIPMSSGTTRHRVQSYFVAAMGGNHNLRPGIDKPETPTKNCLFFLYSLSLWGEEGVRDLWRLQ